jgi:hypothetical protein
VSGVASLLTRGGPFCDNPAVAQHDIEVRVPREITVVNADLEIKVYSDQRLLGEVHVSRGTIDWLPSRGKSRYRLGWESFADVMHENGRRRPR